MKGFLRNYVISLLFLISANALAAFENGNSIYEKLTSDNPMMRINAMGYIMGVVDATKSEPNKNIAYCLPSEITKRQINDIVKLFLEMYPEYRSWAGSDVVSISLAAKFSCQH